MSLPKSKVAEFFQFAMDRENIRILKEKGSPAPWTDDPVLSGFYFCNIFREDDKTTIWFRENIRDRVANRSYWRQVMAAVAFRWFNYIPTGEAIGWVIRQWGWSREHAEPELRKLQERGDKLFTGAYLIKSPPGVDKVTGILDCIDAVVAHKVVAVAQETNSLRATHEQLMTYPYLGPFMAYEVVTDLVHTSLLSGATDRMTWASAGPGCARGLEWISGVLHGYTARQGQQKMLGEMQVLLDASKRHWPWGNRPWSMREVEHTLCEFDKYKRGCHGKKLKRLYRKGS